MNLFLLFLGWPFAAIYYPAEIGLMYLTGKGNFAVLKSELADPALQLDVKGSCFQHFIVGLHPPIDSTEFQPFLEPPYKK